MNCLAEVYNNQNSLPLRDGKQLLNKIMTDLNVGNLKSVEIVLDMGCGSGNLSILLSESLTGVQQIYGVDIDQQMIEFAKQNNSGQNNNILYLAQDLSEEWDDIRPELKAIEGKVSVVFTNHCLHWVYRQKQNVFFNLSRLLAKNGKIYATFLCIPNPLSNFGSISAAIVRYLMGIPTKETQTNEWKEVFLKNGLTLSTYEITSESFQFEREIIEKYVIPNGFKIYEQFLGTFIYTICDNFLKVIKIKPKNIFKEVLDKTTNKVMFETNYDKFVFVLDKY